MSTSLRIVMFPHPAAEYIPKRTKGSPADSGWNMGKHRRRLLLRDGEYVDRKGKLQKGTIAFWGEWEANTLVTKLPTSQNPTDARWVHEPQYPTPCPVKKPSANEESDLDCCMNTDPCVFGSSFKYALCRQKRKFRGRMVKTEMQDLAPGSLIVFCGRTHGAYYLDTVFVVADSIKYDGPDKVSPQKITCDQRYRILTLDQTRGDLTLYRGVTYSSASDGPYSFVPGSVVNGGVKSLVALPSQAQARCPLDFARLNHVMGQQFFSLNYWRGFKSEVASQKTIQRVWNELMRQTRNNFVPGVHFEYP